MDQIIATGLWFLPAKKPVHTQTLLPVDTHRRQVAHHEEGGEGGVEQEGDSLGGRSRGA